MTVTDKNVESQSYSRRVLDVSKSNIKSDVAVSYKSLAGKLNNKIEGQYGHRVVIKTGSVSIDNSELDCEFEIPFDDDTEANEANLTVYNLKGTTIKQIKRNSKITVTAGYGRDTGIIFSGYIKRIKTYREGCDKITEIEMLDSRDLKERDIESISYKANTSASYILKDLCQRLNLTIAIFKTERDFKFTDDTTVDGGLMENIRKYSKICGVSAFICKSAIYVCPLSYGNNMNFTVSSNTGLIDVAEFEEEQTVEEYKDVIQGYEITMLLQHRIATASIINIDSIYAKGRYRVREGHHTYNGTDFLTTFKCIKDKNQPPKKKGNG